MKQLTPVAIALGSNLGDRLAVIRRAMETLGEDLLEGAKSSSIYESDPWGKTDQPKFLNAVIVGLSEWKPPAIVNYLRDLERRLGRLPSSERNGPRHIDLDLLAWGDRTWDEDSIVVPHPRMQERAFVLVPLGELWPQWRHPRMKKTVSELVKALPAGSTLTTVAAASDTTT
jgi:2-amino-4-hydroxy-6-hydroxymethyldihydropteridine diphosphokinase